jgi:hypothetical protein
VKVKDNIWVEVRQLAQPLDEDVGVVAVVAEDFAVGEESHGRAALGGGFEPLERGDGRAALVLLVVQVAVARDIDLQPLRERVHDRHADAVQPARHAVAAAAELAARVQRGHHHLHARTPLFRVDVHRNAAPVVDDRHTLVGVQNHLDMVAVPCERLVDGVVQHLDEQVVQSAHARVADIHRGATAHRFQPLQYRELLSGVFTFHDAAKTVRRLADDLHAAGLDGFADGRGRLRLACFPLDRHRFRMPPC